MEIREHFGVYGVCFRDNQLLCIEKNAGPYKGRFDLPGGSQQVGEGLTDTLVREVLEETGYTIASYQHPRIYDAFVKEKGKRFMVHHIITFYNFTIDHRVAQKTLPFLVADGENDANAVRWLKLEELSFENSSPLVLKLKKEWLGETSLDKDIYQSWEEHETD